MKSKPIITTLLLAAVVATPILIARTDSREGWSGFTIQKSLDVYGRIVQRTEATAGGLRSSVDRFSRSYWYPEDPNGMQPINSDIRGHGIVFIWGHTPETRRAFFWQLTYGYESTIEEIKDFGLDSFGMSYFSGLLVTPDGRNKTIGGFGYDVENRGIDTLSVTVTADWLSNEIVQEHTTTHGGRVAPGDLLIVAARPDGDDYASANNVSGEVK